MQVIINPGTEPVPDATLDNAETNIARFIVDLAIDRVKAVLIPNDARAGRYRFILYRESGGGTRATLVDMPGLPLPQVRWQHGDNPWLFPRLYVNGSSWLWGYALSSAADDLLGGDGDE